MTRYAKDKLGDDLAQRVYEYLERNNSIGFSHYGYCGVGFVKQGQSILYTHFDEWLTYRTGKLYVPGEEYLGIIRIFPEKDAFIRWLAAESDYSLSGIESGDDWYTGNQRISRHRLEFVLSKENR